MKEIKNVSQGFTLLELLVVVVIIAILAAIALPQYKMAVAKSQYSTLKNITRSIADSANRFYLSNNRYPQSYQELDIDLKITLSTSSDKHFNIWFPNVGHCRVWFDGYNNVMCQSKGTGKIMRYYMNIIPQKPYMCVTNSFDRTDLYNKLCQQETNKTKEQAKEADGIYSCYLY